ncbi:MAG: hypothetical protein WBC98_02755 [Candidatus Zixiibacteriota bacterium]
MTIYWLSIILASIKFSHNLTPFYFSFRVSFDPEDLRIEGNPFRVNPYPFHVGNPAKAGERGIGEKAGCQDLT